MSWSIIAAVALLAFLNGWYWGSVHTSRAWRRSLRGALITPPPPCPACMDEAFIAQTFPVDTAGCRSVYVRRSPRSELCAVHAREKDTLS